MSSSGPAISVIVPCLEDATALRRCLRVLHSGAAARGLQLQTVVADASSRDDCAQIAGSAGATVVRCDRPGRGQQLNAGAAVATGEILVFNHADTELEGSHLAAIARTMGSEGSAFVGGAFYRDLAWQYPAFAPMERLARSYTRHMGILYGDQSLFVRRKAFDAMRGFADIPIMEDVEFSSRLRKIGQVVLLDPPLRSSMRRFQRRGYLRNKLQNILVVWLWRAQIASPEQIYRWYYRRSAE